MHNGRHTLAHVSVSFRDCLPCEKTISAFRTMALDAAAKQLAVQVGVCAARYVLSATISDGARSGTWRAEADSLPVAIERIRRQVETWRDASGLLRTDRAHLRTVHAAHGQQRDVSPARSVDQSR